MFATNSRWMSMPQYEASSVMYLQYEDSNSKCPNTGRCNDEVFLLEDVGITREHFSDIIRPDMHRGSAPAAGLE